MGERGHRKPASATGPSLGERLGIASFALAWTLVVLTAWPGFDLVFARAFYALEGGSFAARFMRPLILLRDVGYYLPFAVLTLMALVWLAGRIGLLSSRLVSTRQIVFLASTFALGPGLIVNGVLKEISHRPRPAQLAELGGADAFRPWYAFDGTCLRNCSFASGEAAGATWLIAPALLAPPAWRAPAVAGAALFAAAVSLLRMLFGGHFLADVVAGALVTLICIFVIGRALWPRAGPAGGACSSL